jgi:quinol monooxygenase YgiN
MSEVVVVATFRGQPGTGDQIEEGLQETIRQTHGEAGCILFAPHRGVRDPDVVVLVERWESAEHLAAHAKQPWVTGLSSLRDLLREPPAIDLLTATPAGDPVKGSLAG